MNTYIATDNFTIIEFFANFHRFLHSFVNTQGIFLSKKLKRNDVSSFRIGPTDRPAQNRWGIKKNA